MGIIVRNMSNFSNVRLGSVNSTDFPDISDYTLLGGGTYNGLTGEGIANAVVV